MASCSGIGIKEIGSTKVYLQGSITGLSSSKRYCLHHYWGGWRNLPRSGVSYTYISGVASFNLGSAGCYVPKNMTVEGQQFEVRLHEVERTCESIITEACSKVLRYEVTEQRRVHFYVVDNERNPVNNARCECAGETVYTGSSGRASLVLDTKAKYYARGYAPSGYECTDCYEAFYHTTDRIINFSMKKKPVDGMLAIGSSPHGAKVYVNNVYRGTTPPTQYNYITLPAGTYNVKLTLDGYKDATTTVRVDPGRTTYYSPVLEAETGNVYVTAKLSDGTPLTGAEIYVDGVATRVLTPGTVTVSAGRHTITAKKEV